MAVRPALPLPPELHAQPQPRPWLWLLPLGLAVLFGISVLLWQEHERQADIDQRRAALISDALSLEARLHERVDVEQARLNSVAADLGRQAADGLAPRPLLSVEGVAQGLQRGWASVVWLDADNRQIAQVPDERQPQQHRDGDERQGLSVHLSARIPGAGSLVVRYQPAELLRHDTPWWLSQRYDIRFVDSLGQTLAGLEDVPRPGGGQSHTLQFDPPWPGVTLQLTEKHPLANSVWSAMPVLLMGGFVLLLTWASWLLRRQMIQATQAEQAWYAEAAWRRAMEDSLTVGMRARADDGTLLYVNRAMADMVGWTAQELIGRAPPMPYWSPDAVDEILGRLKRIAASHTTREDYEARWTRRDGRELQVMIFESPLIDASGRRIGWMGSVIDLTERRVAEERERQRIETMTHHARLTTLGEIASTLAHELNQPLTAMASYSAGVLNALRKRGFEDASIEQALERLGEQAQHAARIVQRIREFLSRREPALEACNLLDVAQQAAQLVSRDLARRGVTLLIDAPPDLPPVRADAVLIEQALINLVRNAADALTAPAQGNNSGSATQRPTVHVRLHRSHQGFVRIDVEDNGPGLGGKSLDLLSQPFFSTKPEGMGMGLAICRSIVEIHYGVLHAEDRPGEGGVSGARFSFTLPQWKPEDEPEPHEPNKDQPHA